MSWTQIDGSSQDWTETGASAKTWAGPAGGTADLWNRPKPVVDDSGGVDFRPAIGGGWVIGPHRNQIRIGGASPEGRP